MKKKLRLLLFSTCNRSCEGCCNKQWDLNELPVCTDFTGYDEIILTGGEPMLNPMLVEQTAKRVREDHQGALYMYTAKLDDISYLIRLLEDLDGLCVTLHEQEDVHVWQSFNHYLPASQRSKSLRLNVFDGIDLDGIDTTDWVVKEGIEWIADCPLPPGEVFMRLGE